MRSKLLALLIAALLLTPTFAFAQNIQLEFNRWDVQINVQPNNNQLQIAESEEIHILNGTISKGSRFWTDPVQVQTVYVIQGNNANPVQLKPSSNGQPGTYTVTQTNDTPTLQYVLPQPQNAGSTFTVQINYTATSPTQGMVDWTVIPGDRNFNVRSSTIRVRLPNGQAPDSSLVRVSRGSGTVQVNGNEIVIQSQGAVPPQQPFTIQIPYGAGVGAAGGNTSNQNSGNEPAPVNPNPGIAPASPSTEFQLPGIGTILLILCVVGLLILFGGGSLLRGLLGGIGSGTLSGGGQQGPFPGDSSGVGGTDNNPVEPSGGLDRGFRPSANQNRDIGNVGDDKKSGGGVNFG